MIYIFCSSFTPESFCTLNFFRFRNEFYKVANIFKNISEILASTRYISFYTNFEGTKKKMRKVPKIHMHNIFLYTVFLRPMLSELLNGKLSNLHKAYTTFVWLIITRHAKITLSKYDSSPCWPLILFIITLILTFDLSKIYS